MAAPVRAPGTLFMLAAIQTSFAGSAAPWRQDRFVISALDAPAKEQFPQLNLSFRYGQLADANFTMILGQMAVQVTASNPFGNSDEILAAAEAHKCVAAYPPCTWSWHDLSCALWVWMPSRVCPRRIVSVQAHARARVCVCACAGACAATCNLRIVYVLIQGIPLIMVCVAPSASAQRHRQQQRCPQFKGPLVTSCPV